MEDAPPTTALPPTQDERTMAALAHASVLLGFTGIPFLGLLAAGAIWLSQRDRSVWAAWQALQALAWQLSQMVVGIVAGLCVVMLAFGGLLAGAASTSMGQQGPPDGVMAGALAGGFGGLAAFLALLFLLGFVWTAVGLWAAYRAYQGVNYRYPVIGRLVAAPPGIDLASPV
jgi:uncharacterized Tic20 family protein